MALLLMAMVEANDTSSVAAPMNEYVLQVIDKFPTDGSCPYWWPKENVYDGATTDVYFQGKKVMRGDPEGKRRNYCCGLTLQVFYQALNAYKEEGHELPPSKFSPEHSSDFKRLWFCPSLKSPGPVLALEKYGIGKQIKDLDKASAGDFVQIWRNSGSGHSVIFNEWERNDQGKITGLKYWSSQGATDGIGYRTEPVGDGKKDITRDLIFIGRLLPPSEWEAPAEKK